MRVLWLALFLCTRVFAAPPGAVRGGLVEDLRYGMAVKAAQERRWPTARALFSALAKAYPADSRAKVQLAQVELESGHADKAQAIALEVLAKEPTDAFAKAVLERTRKKSVVPEPPPTFGDEPPLPGAWERGDEFHLGVPVLTRAGVLSIGEPRFVEGPAPTPLEPPPAVKYKLRAEVAGGPATETALDPAPGPTALLEKMGKDGKLGGELVSLPPGMEMPKEAHVPVYLGATRLAIFDPAGALRAERALSTDALYRGLMAIARPAPVEGLFAPLGPKPTGPNKVLPLARLSARLRHEYSPAGQPSGMWLRVRLVGELFVYPGLRGVPDAEVPRACPYLLWPLEPTKEGPEALDFVVQKLAAYLDKPSKSTREKAVLSFKPFADRLDRDLKDVLGHFRDGQAKSVTSPVTRELRSLVTLVLVSGRLARLSQESDAAGSEAKQRAAEALILLSRFRLARK